MSFVSFSFMILFFIAIGLRLIIGREGREPAYLQALLLSSLVFYGWHVPEYLGILIFSCLVDYFAALLLSRYTTRRNLRFFLLLISMGTNLGLLCLFKYANFGIDIARSIAATYGLVIENQSALDWMLPMGISFYTFQSMSYTIDVYRFQMKPERSFMRFLLYVSFFPQLVAGPIVRAPEFLYQLDRRRRVRLFVFWEGAYLIIRGLFFKVVVADNLSVAVDRYWEFASSPECKSILPMLLPVLFSFQIFSILQGTPVLHGELPCVLDFVYLKILTRRLLPRLSVISGAAGISPCRSGSGIICIFR